MKEEQKSHQLSQVLMPLSIPQRPRFAKVSVRSGSSTSSMSLDEIDQAFKALESFEKSGERSPKVNSLAIMPLIAKNAAKASNLANLKPIMKKSSSGTMLVPSSKKSMSFADLDLLSDSDCGNSVELAQEFSYPKLKLIEQTLSIPSTVTKASSTMPVGEGESSGTCS